MLQNKTIAMTALVLSLSAGAANAHVILPITTGDPFTITEPTLNWTGSSASSLNNTLLDTNVLGFHFSVTTAGSLDVYTDDHDDPNSKGDVFIFQKDAVGTDWTLVTHSYEGPRVDMNTPTNIFGVHITGYINAGTAGISDMGVRSNFGIGDYVALIVPSQGKMVGFDPISSDQNLVDGTKLSAGFTWSWLQEPCNTSGLCSGIPGLSDFFIKASPGSLAVAGPTVEPPPAAVPVPGAVWLMGSVLAGFTALGRKKAAVAA